jgi:hypothetical protein
MVQAGVGVAAGAEAAVAAQLAVEEAVRALGSAPASLALVFASSTYNQNDVVKTVRNLLGKNVPVVGGSTAGEISHRGPSLSPSVVVMLLSFPSSVYVATALVPEAHESSEAKGAALALALKKALHGTPLLTLMVGDGLTINPSAILRGFQAELPLVPVVGGSASDEGKYVQTFQYANDTVHSSSISAVALTGDIKYAMGVRHGWNPISAPKLVTKADGRVIYEIDGKPAAQLYEEFIGKEETENLKGVTLAQMALSYPLGIKDDSSGEMLLRAPFFVDANGSITCGGEVLPGASVQLMIGAREDAIDAARQSAAQALAELGTVPKAAIVFSSHVRDQLYATREQSKLEIDAIQEVIGLSVPIAGFYTYAEQAPVQEGEFTAGVCNNVNHNETIVIVLLG